MIPAGVDRARSTRSVTTQTDTMLEIGNRKNVFYWQTDRNLTVEDYEAFFLKRHSTDPQRITEVLQRGLTSVPKLDTVRIIEPDEDIKKGNVNIVRKITIGESPYIVRLHPAGVKNEYFYVEKVAQDMAISRGLPAPKILEVHEATDEKDMDFVLATVLPGQTMQSVIEKNPASEPELLFQAGALMAGIHKIKVEKFGSFDNRVSKNEGRLVGLHETYKDFVWCGLVENLGRLISFNVITGVQGKRLQDFFESHNFEPVDEPRLVHNDFADWNILVNDGSISGLLDWDECHGGDPVADLACWSTFYSIERFEEFLKGYKSVSDLPVDFKQRFHYYRLRYIISKMALRTKRAQVDKSQFVLDKIKVGRKALEEELNIL